MTSYAYISHCNDNVGSTSLSHLKCANFVQQIWFYLTRNHSNIAILYRLIITRNFSNVSEMFYRIFTPYVATNNLARRL